MGGDDNWGSAMSKIPLPWNELHRLKKLQGCGILDTEPDESFNRITRILSQTMGTPISLISFVDAYRQWFKSKVGIDVSETPREFAFCGHAICGTDIFEVKDATKDERFLSNPLVTGSPDIRFYAGAPLVMEGGVSLGTLCTIDTKPRSLSNDERRLLADLAGVVVDQLEMKLLARRATDAEARLIDAVEAIPDGFVLYDNDDRLVMCNQRYKDTYPESADLFTPGTSFADIIRTGVNRGQYPEAIGNEDAWFAERMRQHKHADEPIEQELPNDRWVRIEERATSEGGLVGFRVDITQLKRQQRELKRLAWTDSLTGALNRGRFMELARTELGRAKRSENETALALIDVDHFKKINDRNGHAAGDAVLSELVGRWEAELRDYDHLARIGGEEFAILLPECDLSGATTVVRRLLEVASAEPVRCNDMTIPVTVSAGIAVCPSYGETLDEAFVRADDALYQAKREGRDRFVEALPQRKDLSAACRAG